MFIPRLTSQLLAAFNTHARTHARILGCGSTFSIDVAKGDTAITRLEHVEVWVNIATSHRGYVVIDLDCPTGTPSNMLGTRRDSSSSSIIWKMSTVRCWGEEPHGRFVSARCVGPGTGSCSCYVCVGPTGMELCCATFNSADVSRILLPYQVYPQSELFKRLIGLEHAQGMASDSTRHRFCRATCNR